MTGLYMYSVHYQTDLLSSAVLVVCINLIYGVSQLILVILYSCIVITLSKLLNRCVLRPTQPATLSGMGNEYLAYPELATV